MKLYMRLLLHLTSTGLGGWFLLGIRKGVRIIIAQQELQWHFHVWTMRIFMLTIADRSTPARESIFVT
ncbi:uncharacterized protein FRV6_09490 [Fusarium oxysporum]|uniref:Uncharacterized protein n=1 Tax=Fusarium oxysporum TaxID=5507 RepID=A0A2H3T9G9_FUSOX|nr:uncharacterized protein FRV6_09490 [Fusarium oxysporum]